MLGKAISIASNAFVDKKDKGGQPYILHCLYVMNEVQHLGNEVMTVAVLHDLVEDCPEWDFDKLSAMGFDNKIIGCLRLLTHNKDVAYMDYIKELSHNDICREVKKADLKHNSQIYRLKGLTKKDFDRLQTYCTAYEYLKD